jgi:hypothetical protein
MGGEGGDGSGTSMVPVMGDGNGEGEVMGCGYFQRGRRQGGSMVREVGSIAKSGTTTGEAEGVGG